MIFDKLLNTNIIHYHFKKFLLDHHLSYMAFISLQHAKNYMPVKLYNPAPHKSFRLQLTGERSIKQPLDTNHEGQCDIAS